MLLLDRPMKRKDSAVQRCYLPAVSGLWYICTYAFLLPAWPPNSFSFETTARLEVYIYIHGSLSPLRPNKPWMKPS